MYPPCTQHSSETNVPLDIKTDAGWYKKAHRIRWAFCLHAEEAAFLARFRKQGEAGKVIEVTEIHLAFQKEAGPRVSPDAIIISYIIS